MACLVLRAAQRGEQQHPALHAAALLQSFLLPALMVMLEYATAFHLLWMAEGCSLDGLKAASAKVDILPHGSKS
jgi:hypothetical protein